MLRESQESALLGAAIAGDPEVYGEMNEEELEAYNGYVKWLEEVKERHGGSLDGVEIDIPYSLMDPDDYDE